jgi:iron complex outermembrane receptor protein
MKIFNSLPFGINQSWTFSYEDRITLGDHFTVDTKLSKNFSNLNVFVKASNLLNKSYEEIPGVPLPGRWIIGGVKYNIL